MIHCSVLGKAAPLLLSDTGKRQISDSALAASTGSIIAQVEVLLETKIKVKAVQL